MFLIKYNAKRVIKMSFKRQAFAVFLGKKKRILLCKDNFIYKESIPKNSLYNLLNAWKLVFLLLNYDQNEVAVNYPNGYMT